MFLQIVIVRKFLVNFYFYFFANFDYKKLKYFFLINFFFSFTNCYCKNVHDILFLICKLWLHNSSRWIQVQHPWWKLWASQASQLNILAIVHESFIQIFGMVSMHFSKRKKKFQKIVKLLPNLILIITMVWNSQAHSIFFFSPNFCDVAQLVIILYCWVWCQVMPIC